MNGLNGLDYWHANHIGRFFGEIAFIASNPLGFGFWNIFGDAS